MTDNENSSEKLVEINKFLTITTAAQEYLKELLAGQDSPGIGVRIFVEKPGTPYAECCMAYCPEGEAQEDDIKLDFTYFPAYVELHSEIYLEDAVIDYQKDRMGGQLTFKAPKSKVPQLGDDASLEERVNYLLYTEINPQLSSHGGHVSLVELVEDNTVAVLQFGGGCQGCAAVDMTLKDGVEKRLLEEIPELKRVTDQTDHTVKDNAYY